MERNDKSTTALAFFIGAAVGVAAGLLSQKNVRDKLQEKYYEGKEQMAKKARELQESAGQKKEQIKGTIAEKSSDINEGIQQRTGRR